MNNKTTNVRYLAQLALLAAIEVVMKLMGLGSVPVGPLYMSFLTVPIAVGAMTMGPTAGAILGGVFGCVGCGRCLRSCPISMNIVKVMKTLEG